MQIGITLYKLVVTILITIIINTAPSQLPIYTVGGRGRGRGRGREEEGGGGGEGEGEGEGGGGGGGGRGRGFTLPPSQFYLTEHSPGFVS